MKGSIMKILILNKEEKEILTSLLIKKIKTPGCPYELMSILEKLNPGAYDYVFQK